MRRSGTGFRDGSTPAWLCLLWLCGSACGDSVVVAREFSLVSAAVESRDAGSDADERNDEPSFGHGGTGSLGPRPPTHFGAGGSQSTGSHASKDGNGGTGGGSSKSDEPKHP